MAYVEDAELNGWGLEDNPAGTGCFLRVSVRNQKERDAVLREEADSGRGGTVITLRGSGDKALCDFVAGLMGVPPHRVRVVAREGKNLLRLHIGGREAGQATGTLLSRAVQNERETA